MAETFDISKQPPNPEPSQEIPDLKINITLKPNGQVMLEGNVLNNNLTALGMLEIAKVTILQHNSKPPIIQPKGNIMNFARKRF